MNADDLRAPQAPLKARYRDDPRSAVGTLNTRGSLLRSDGRHAVERTPPKR